MTTPTPIPDFCVSSQADGFDEFLKVFNKHFRKSYIGNLSYYGYLKTESYCGKERLFAPLITPSSAIALLTKPLTEGDLIVGNMFECIEDIINGREGVSFTKGEKYKCELDKSITNNFGYPQYTFKDSEYLNRHFKLLPTQESVKERNGDPSMDEMIQLVEQLESDKFHLQQQLKEANLLLLNIKNTIELNNIQKVFPETYPQINQFLTRNK